MWKEYFGYMVSDEGLITKKNSTELQSTKLHNRGYVLVHISVDGVKQWVLLHRLVAELFIPNPEHKPQVNHINGIKTDNRVENLEWVTNQENRDHAVKLGLIAKGDSLSKKLTSAEVLAIKEEYIPYSKDHNQYTLAKKYGVCQSMIKDILKDYKWKSINV